MNKKTRGQEPLAFERGQSEVYAAGQNARTGRAALSNAADLAARAQLSDCAPVESISPKVSITLREGYKAGHNECGSTTCAPMETATPKICTMPTGKKFKFFNNKRLLKVVGASTLALFMGIGSLCGVLSAPRNVAANMAAREETASATQASSATNTETYGLVTPCEDDPVVYKTDYGLEIKFGAAFTSGTSLGSGNLTGFPYFTSGGYTWVIIGRSTTMTSLLHQKLSQYQTDKSYFTNFTYLFNNIYETTSPAGAAIKNDNVLNDYCASPISIANISFANIINSSIKSNAEIPANCVLIISNSHLTTGNWKTEYDWQTNGVNFYYLNVFQSYSSSDRGIYYTMNNWVTNGSYGISSFKSKLKSVTMKTSCWVQDYSAIYDYAYNASYSQTLNIFPLARVSGNGFYYGTYLTAAQMKTSANQWLRGSTSENMWRIHIMDSSGSIIDGFTKPESNGLNLPYSAGYRPAMVLSLV